MQLGDQITCSERWFLNNVEKEPLIRHGSVGCFLSSGNGQSRVDFFTTARHVTKATMGEDTLVVDIFDASKATQGKIFAESEDALDASLVQIVLGSALQQGANRLPGVQVN